MFIFIDRYRVISSSAPLLLSCGHPICSLCAIKQRQIVCKICNENHEHGESGPDKLPPVNSYVIGLLRSLETRNGVTVTEKKELEFSFQPAFESRLEKKFQGKFCFLFQIILLNKLQFCLFYLLKKFLPLRVFVFLRKIKNENVIKTQLLNILIL